MPGVGGVSFRLVRKCSAGSLLPGDGLQMEPAAHRWSSMMNPAVETARSKAWGQETPKRPLLGWDSVSLDFDWLWVLSILFSLFWWLNWITNFSFTMGKDNPLQFRSFRDLLHPAGPHLLKCSPLPNTHTSVLTPVPGGGRWKWSQRIPPSEFWNNKKRVFVYSKTKKSTLALYLRLKRQRSGEKGGSWLKYANSTFKNKSEKTYRKKITFSGMQNIKEGTK